MSMRARRMVQGMSGRPSEPKTKTRLLRPGVSARRGCGWRLRAAGLFDPGPVVGPSASPRVIDRTVSSGGGFGRAPVVCGVAAAPSSVARCRVRTKKAWLRSYGKRFAEVLSLFRSRQVRDAVEREARRSGVEVRYVDPAWTTRLGKLKYRRHCRLGPHHAAALVIGRRGLGIGERLPHDAPSLPYTVECVSTTGASRTLVQRLPAAWLQGGRRRTGQRARAPDAPGAGA